jgi:hypothetical protein
LTAFIVAYLHNGHHLARLQRALNRACPILKTVFDRVMKNETPVPILTAAFGLMTQLFQFSPDYEGVACTVMEKNCVCPEGAEAVVITFWEVVANWLHVRWKDQIAIRLLTIQLRAVDRQDTEVIDAFCEILLSLPQAELIRSPSVVDIAQNMSFGDLLPEGIRRLASATELCI